MALSGLGASMGFVGGAEGVAIVECGVGITRERSDVAANNEDLRQKAESDAQACTGLLRLAPDCCSASEFVSKSGRYCCATKMTPISAATICRLLRVVYGQRC